MLQHVRKAMISERVGERLTHRRVCGAGGHWIQCEPSFPIVPMKLSLVLARWFDVEDASGGDNGVVNTEVNAEAGEISLGVGKVSTFRVRFEHATPIRFQFVNDGIGARHADKRCKGSHGALQDPRGVRVEKHDAL
jgi:hypothetical protein